MHGESKPSELHITFPVWYMLDTAGVHHWDAPMAIQSRDAYAHDLWFKKPGLITTTG